MSVADYIEKKFMNKVICIMYESEGSVITHCDGWVIDKEYMRGMVVEVDEGVVVLEIPNSGLFYLNEEKIISFFEPGFDIHKAVSMSLSKRQLGAKRKD